MPARLPACLLLPLYSIPPPHHPTCPLPLRPCRPERFLDAEAAARRHPYAFLPFGLGPRMCIGWRLAMQELQISLIR